VPRIGMHTARTPGTAAAAWATAAAWCPATSTSTETPNAAAAVTALSVATFSDRLSCSAMTRTAMAGLLLSG
jgi:hypothetical protein